VQKSPLGQGKKMKTIKLYHGTRADPESLKEYGLLAGGLDRTEKDPRTQKYIVNKERTLQRILAEFGLTKSDIPEWCYRGELEYEANLPIHIHFCLNFKNAEGYSFMGGEPAYCIRSNILTWLEIKRIAKNKKIIPEEVTMDMIPKEILWKIKEWAAKINGSQRHVVETEIELNDDRIEKSALETIHKLEKFKNRFKDIFETTAMEIRYYGDISPNKLKIHSV